MRRAQRRHPPGQTLAARAARAARAALAAVAALAVALLAQVASLPRIETHLRMRGRGPTHTLRIPYAYPTQQASGAAVACTTRYHAHS